MAKRPGKSLGDRWRALLTRFTDRQTKAAQANLLEKVFYDMYRDRKRIYKLNFFRGIFFGLGSALGGTLVLAILIWILSLFVDFPLIGDYLREAQQSLRQSDGP